MDHLKLSYFGHVIRASDVEYDLLTGMVYGKRQAKNLNHRWYPETNRDDTRKSSHSGKRQSNLRLVHDVTASQPDPHNVDVSVSSTSVLICITHFIGAKATNQVLTGIPFIAFVEDCIFVRDVVTVYPWVIALEILGSYNYQFLHIYYLMYFLVLIYISVDESVIPDLS